jgi:hypothetical protein
MHDIVTCSLDKTIKVWNVKDTSAPAFPQTDSFAQKISGQLPQPLTTIMTRYPVWRARDLPFGSGILSLPQRGDTALEMWVTGNNIVPVEILEGHTDVVKEFVWRKGGMGAYMLTLWKLALNASCRWIRVPANYMVERSHFEVLACGFGDYGGKCREPLEITSLTSF